MGPPQPAIGCRSEGRDAMTTPNLQSKGLPHPTPLARLLAVPWFCEPFLVWTLRRCNSAAEAEDVVAAARLRASLRESSGDAWQPGGPVPATHHFLTTVAQVLRVKRQLAADRLGETMREPYDADSNAELEAIGRQPRGRIRAELAARGADVKHVMAIGTRGRRA
jgi:hypothetical protein